MRRLNTTPAPIKKQKVYTVTIKTKKKSTLAPIIVEEAESKEDSDSVYRLENE